METDQGPKFKTEEEVKSYLTRIGLTDDEASAVAPTWVEREPQTMKEIEAGRKWEEKNRLDSATSWADDIE